jgi:hypothetical protein
LRPDGFRKEFKRSDSVPEHPVALASYRGIVQVHQFEYGFTAITVLIVISAYPNGREVLVIDGSSQRTPIAVGASCAQQSLYWVYTPALHCLQRAQFGQLTCIEFLQWQFQNMVFCQALRTGY